MTPPDFPNYTSLDNILTLFKPKDSLAVPLATGQPLALMTALSNRSDWQRLDIFTGLLTFPYPILMNPNVYVLSGYYGPIERALNAQGAHMEYLPADFRGIETYAKKRPSRIIATTVSPPDADGHVTFGTHGAAVYNPFVAACRNPDQLAIAEVNRQMPVVYGDPHYGDNKIHASEIDYLFDSDQTQVSVPAITANDVEARIAEHALALIPAGATLQFGIGAIPNHIAESLARGPLGDFGIHSELLSDGFLKLWEAGKISNRHKALFPNASVFTFAFGSQALYDFLDERNHRNRRQAICLPVNVVNSPAVIAQHRTMVSINSGLMVDFAGQVSSEAIGLRQYSGVGGQLSFVEGAYFSDGGKSILCIKSTAEVNGQTVSNILPTLPQGSLISTPRHYTQTIVTEYGTADLYGVSDEHRAQKLIPLAHPKFRDELTEAYERMRREFYKN